VTTRPAAADRPPHADSLAVLGACS
jgi:hypothetical protein